MQDRQGACRHGNKVRETPQCKHRGGREVCITSLLLRNDTFTSRSVDCAAVAAATAAAAAAVKMIIAAYRYECKVMHSKHSSLCESGHIVSQVHHGESVQKTTADRHSHHLLLVWSKQ